MAVGDPADLGVEPRHLGVGDGAQRVDERHVDEDAPLVHAHVEFPHLPLIGREGFEQLADRALRRHIVPAVGAESRDPLLVVPPEMSVLVGRRGLVLAGLAGLGHSHHQAVALVVLLDRCAQRVAALPQAEGQRHRGRPGHRAVQLLEADFRPPVRRHESALRCEALEGGVPCVDRPAAADMVRDARGAGHAGEPELRGFVVEGVGGAPQLRGRVLPIAVRARAFQVAGAPAFNVQSEIIHHPNIASTSTGSKCKMNLCFRILGSLENPRARISATVLVFVAWALTRRPVDGSVQFVAPGRGPQ